MKAFQGLARGLPLDTGRAEFWSVGIAGYLDENVPVITVRNESQLLAARQRVTQAAEGIAEGIFKPNIGIHCDFCAYRSLCPAKEKRIPHPVKEEVKQSN